MSEDEWKDGEDHDTYQRLQYKIDGKDIKVRFMDNEKDLALLDEYMMVAATEEDKEMDKIRRGATVEIHSLPERKAYQDYLIGKAISWRNVLIWAAIFEQHMEKNQSE